MSRSHNDVDNNSSNNYRSHNYRSDNNRSDNNRSQNSRDNISSNDSSSDSSSDRGSSSGMSSSDTSTLCIKTTLNYCQIFVVFVRDGIHSVAGVVVVVVNLFHDGITQDRFELSS